MRIWMSSMLAFALSACGGEVTVTIEAGTHVRNNTPVWFQLPTATATGNLSLIHGDEINEIQTGPSGRACVILSKLNAGESRIYKVERAIARMQHRTELDFAPSGDSLSLSCARLAPTLHYRSGPAAPPDGVEPIYKRGGYIHPVLTPAGVQITDDYPLKHKHHHGIWWAWTKTEFEGRAPDFWNLAQKKGRVQFRSFGTHKREGETDPDRFTYRDSCFAGFVTSHTYFDMLAQPEKPVLFETWDVKLYNVRENYRLFDFECTQECAGQSPLILPKYHYGGLGFRGHAQWDGKDNCVFLTSEGKDRNNGNETTARWCHIGGKVDGKWAGIAILCHKDNFRAPQPVRLHPTEPFFCYAPQQAGDFKIEPGKPYVSKYRFVIYDGEPDKELLERLYNDYVNPPEVTVK